MALQTHGQSSWGLTLLSTNVVNPATPLDVELRCQRKFGSICLEGSGLSQGAVKAIIACGCIVIVLTLSTLCVIIDIRRRSGRVGLPQQALMVPMQGHMAHLGSAVVLCLISVSEIHGMIRQHQS